MAPYPETDFCPPSEEPPEAPHAYGLYFCGDPVMVERSDGSQSECTIVEYDEVFETFTVNIGGAVCKYGVEESYIQPIEHTKEWAGDFFIGRKVYLSHLPDYGGGERDKTGEIRSFDEKKKL